MEDQNQNQNQSTDKSQASQALEDQSIFVLLGINEGNEAEREDFLDRLQKTIWDDFLDNDVELLLTDEEVKPLVEMINETGIEEDARQEKMVVYLQGLIPDLEDILMEKALRLKENLVRERVLSLEQMVADNEEKMKELREVEELMVQGQWAMVAEKLNAFRL